MELKEKKKNLIERNSDLEGMNQELEKLLADKENEINNLKLRIQAAKLPNNNRVK